MARFLQNKRKYLRRFGLISNHETETRPSSRPTRRKTDFGIQLEEKQKVKFIYGILEKQLERYARQAFRQPGDPRELLLRQLETRLDNVVYRLGFAPTRQQARQLVSHRHVLVNGKKLNIPSYSVRIGNIIALSPKATRFMSQQSTNPMTKPPPLPRWVELSENSREGLIRRLPTKEDLPQDINMQHVIEFLSKRIKR